MIPMKGKLKGFEKSVQPTAHRRSHSIQRTILVLALLLITVSFVGVTSAAIKPVAVDDAYNTDEDTTLNITADVGVLANDSDLDADFLTAVNVTNPTHGILNMSSDGSFTYVPDADWNGSDSFTYNATDGMGDSSIATATIIVNPVNDAPVAANQSVTASIISVTTDKDLYHSKEIMNITVTVSSQGDMSNATLRFKGIQNLHGDFQINTEIPANLSPGLNTLVYKHELPRCSSCSGLNAGTYQVEVQLIHDGSIVSNMTHSFQLEQ